MAWTAPKTWASDEVPSSADLNTYMRDNQIYLKAEVDARIRVKAVTVNYNDSSPKQLLSLAANAVVFDVFCEVTTPFNDAAATLQIGDGGDNDGFLASAETDVDAAGWKGMKENGRGAYLWDGTYKQLKSYDSGDTIDAFISPGSATQGVVVVYITYKA